MENLVYQGEQSPVRFNMARYCLGRAAQTIPDRLGLVVVPDVEASEKTLEQWTYGQLDEAVRRVAAGLRAYGLAPRSRIMIRMGNTSDYALIFFGAIAAGFVPLPSSSQLTEREAIFLLEDSEASMLAVSEELSIATAPGVRVLWPSDIAKLKATPNPPDYLDTAAEEPAFLIYTSGTSGTPKGVLHGQRSAWGRRPMYEGWYGGIGPGDIILHAGAFNWTYTLGVGLTDPWANGATAMLYNGPRDVSVWPRLIERFRATLFATVPGLYRQILKYCDLDSYDLSSLRHGLTAGESLSPMLYGAWCGAAKKELYEALGMSECSTYISSAPSVPVRPGSPGKPQPGRRVVTLPISGGEEVLPEGEIGLLAVHRSDQGLMLGYWNRPEEEAQVYRGEWFVGGDLASFDKDGYVTYHGRNDDLMTAMGYRISPLEVEQCLSQHPSVAEVAVTEITVREDVKIVAAFVVPKDSGCMDASSIITFAHKLLAAYKCPREVIFVNALPRTANGKLLRRELPKLSQYPFSTISSQP